MRQALQLGRLVQAIVTSLLTDGLQSPLTSKAILSKLANKPDAFLSEIGVFAEPDGGDEDLLGESETMRRVVSMRQRILSKTASWSLRLARQQEKLALKQQKRVLFALRTMVLLRRLDRGNLRQIFSMTTVRFIPGHGLQSLLQELLPRISDTDNDI